jgi:putative phosphonate metabolism protein
MRVAVYFVPSGKSSLWSFGARAVGYDSFSGTHLPCFSGADFPEDAVREMTEEPRHYGFHATLRAPFELAEGVSIKEVERLSVEFAQARGRFVVPRLEVAALGRFLALVPPEPSEDLNRLAADCVMAFEPLRGPLAAADLARRLRKPLTPRQQAYVARWGYPYIFEDFRFHMTLTGPLDDHVRARYLAMLSACYTGFAEAVEIDAIALCVQRDRASRFEVVERYAFGAGVCRLDRAAASR